MTEQFFKIPLDKLLQVEGLGFNRIEGGLNESQLAMIEGLNNYRFWVHISARRTGKSLAAAFLALAKLLEPNTQVMVVAPNFSLSSIIWDYVTNFIKKLKLETEKFNQKDRVVNMVNGSTFRLLSANNRDSLVGRAAHFLIVDEAAIIDSAEYFERDLRPALSTYPNSRCLFISTPRGQQNYLYEYFKRGQKEDETKEDEFSNWGSGLFTWKSNPLLSEEDILDAKKSLTKALFEQEYMCSWITSEGAIYNVDPDTHLTDLSNVANNTKRYDIIGGLDMGYRDATAFVVVATDGTEFYVIDEYVAHEGTTSTHAAEIQRLIDEYNIESIYIDSAAQQVKADLAYDFDIYTDNAVKSVNDGIATLQNLFVQKHILFDQNNARASFNSVQGYSWNAQSEKQKPKHDEHSHCCDALRYAIYSYLRNRVSIYSRAEAWGMNG